MGVRWSDTQIARRVDLPAFGRTVGSASSTGPGERTATDPGARHPHAAPHRQRALGVRSSARPDPRPLRWPLYVGSALLVIGVVSCHHEDDLFCAEKSCEVQP
jgi:hypothetical protein